MDKSELFQESDKDLRVQMDTDGHYYLIVPYSISPGHPLKKFKKSPNAKKRYKLKTKKRMRRRRRHQRTNDSRAKKHPKRCIPIETTISSGNGGESQTPNSEERTVSIDLGVRTFGTCYTPDGYVYHIGMNNINHLYSLFHYNNKLYGRMTRMTGRHKRSLKKAWIRASKRIHNLVDDCHKKISKWLLEHFTMIIVPKLDVNQFSKKRTSKSTRNKMRLWRHCSFTTCLDNMQRRYPLVSVLHPTEEYTSKTCSNCGSQHPTLGRSKTFICPNPNCQRIFDRDVNSGLNILLKTLTETTNVVLKEFSLGNH
jgi:transposase